MADDDNKRAEDERKHSAEEQRKHAADAEAKRIAQAEDDRKKQAQADDDRKKQASQRALVPNAEGNVIMEVIMGPYRGNYLTMTAADAEEAKDSHWARDPGETDRDHDHVLSEEDRQSALTQAHAWAQAQWDAAAGIEDPDPPPPEGGEGEGGVTRRRAMTPDQPTGGYTTRATPAPTPRPAPTPPRKP